MTSIINQLIDRDNLNQKDQIEKGIIK